MRNVRSPKTGLGAVDRVIADIYRHISKLYSGAGAQEKYRGVIQATDRKGVVIDFRHHYGQTCESPPRGVVTLYALGGGIGRVEVLDKSREALPPEEQWLALVPKSDNPDDFPNGYYQHFITLSETEPYANYVHWRVFDTAGNLYEQGYHTFDYNNVPQVSYDLELEYDFTENAWAVFLLWHRLDEDAVFIDWTFDYDDGQENHHDEGSETVVGGYSGRIRVNPNKLVAPDDVFTVTARAINSCTHGVEAWKRSMVAPTDVSVVASDIQKLRDRIDIRVLEAHFDPDDAEVVAELSAHVDGTSVQEIPVLTLPATVPPGTLLVIEGMEAGEYWAVKVEGQESAPNRIIVAPTEVHAPVGAKVLRPNEYSYGESLYRPNQVVQSVRAKDYYENWVSAGAELGFTRIVGDHTNKTTLPIEPIQAGFSLPAGAPVTVMGVIPRPGTPLFLSQRVLLARALKEGDTSMVVNEAVTCGDRSPVLYRVGEMVSRLAHNETEIKQNSDELALIAREQVDAWAVVDEDVSGEVRSTLAIKPSRSMMLPGWKANLITKTNIIPISLSQRIEVGDTELRFEEQYIECKKGDRIQVDLAYLASEVLIRPGQIQAKVELNEDAIANINATVSDHESRISSTTSILTKNGLKSTTNVMQLATQANALVETSVQWENIDGSYTLRAGPNGSVFKIRADQVQISGQTTFASGYNPATKIEKGGAAADINNNVTTIDGSKITTGSITADKIDVTNLIVTKVNAANNKIKIDDSGIRLLPALRHDDPASLMWGTGLLSIYGANSPNLPFGATGAIQTSGALLLAPGEVPGTSYVRVYGHLSVYQSLLVQGDLGFYGMTPRSKPTVTGSKSGIPALSSLITQLASLGLITDNTT